MRVFPISHIFSHKLAQIPISLKSTRSVFFPLAPHHIITYLLSQEALPFRVLLLTRSSALTNKKALLLWELLARHIHVDAQYNPLYWLRCVRAPTF
jgi:hypothetical protein